MAKLTGGHLASEAEWQAFADRRARDVIYAVATTGIHCRAGCSARTPLRANLRVFDSRAEAEAAGYRACKRCGGGGQKSNE